MLVGLLDYNIPKLGRQEVEAKLNNVTFVRMDKITVDGKELDWGVGEKVKDNPY